MTDYDSDFPGDYVNDEDYDNWFNASKLMDDDFATKIDSGFDNYYSNVVQTNHPKHAINSRKDIWVKVGADFYELDRIQLALKSDYFEKLLTTEFNEKDSPVIAIHSIDSGTFSTIVDIINGVELSQVLNFDNFASLLLAMDYLQMEINLDAFRDIMDWNMKKPVFLQSNIFNLLNFVVQNSNFNYLLSTIYQYLSMNLTDILVSEDFPVMSVAQLEEIIANDKFPQNIEEKSKIGRICATWICADIENRLPHIVTLVNAAKYRYNLPFKVKAENLNVQFFQNVEQDAKQEAIERYFDVLLNYYGEIDPDDAEKTPPSKSHSESPSHSFAVVNKIDENAKWASFLENSHLYDITIKIQNKAYKLHRLKLETASKYFARLSSSVIDKDEKHFFDIDETAFKVVIKFIYFEEIALAPGNIASTLKAAHILEVTNLIEMCKLCIQENADSIPEDFVELLNFTYRTEEFKGVYKFLLNTVCETWPELGSYPNFGSISCDILLAILRSRKLRIKNRDEILDICSEWIAHDPENRYTLMLRIGTAINRNYMAIYGQIGMEVTIDLADDYSQGFIKDRLSDVLSSTCIVPRFGSISIKKWDFDQQQMFIYADDHKLSLLDSTMNEIASMGLFKVKQQNPEEKARLYFRSDPSAAIIKDNIFIFHQISGQNCFCVYNSRSKKFYSLASLDYHTKHTKSDRNRDYKLLNCKDELYCCFTDGQVFEYSIELNRWMTISESRSHLDEHSDYKPIVHISDGKDLYRVYRKSEAGHLYSPVFADYLAEVFDFEQYSWVPLPELYSRRSEASSRDFCNKSSSMVSCATIIGDLAILFAYTPTILLLDYFTQTWREFEIPFGITMDRMVSIFTQLDKDEMYIMTDTNLYRVTLSNGQYKLVRSFVCNANAVHAICV